jgi:hypothetical protein
MRRFLHGFKSKKNDSPEICFLMLPETVGNDLGKALHGKDHHEDDLQHVKGTGEGDS